MKIIYMGTPDFAVAPLVEINSKYEVVLVVTQVDAKKGRGKKLAPPPVKVAAEELGLEVYQTENINSQESIEYLKSKDADIFVVASFGQILKKEVLDIPKFYPINIHASLLPKYRGAAPVNMAIINGEEVTGISIMKMGEGLDDGDVALMLDHNIGDENAEDLTKSLSNLGARAIMGFLAQHESGEVKFSPQDHSKSTYVGKINKSMGEIDFNSSSKSIVNLIKGLYPQPGAFTKIGDAVLKIYSGKVVEYSGNEQPGTVISSKKELIIKTEDGAVSVEELQLPGKKRMDIVSFLLGNPIEEGIILGG